MFAITSIHTFINPVLGGMAALATLVCSFLIVISGIRYIASRGDPQLLSQAKRNILRALAGLVIILASATFGMFLSHSYGTPNAISGSSLPSINAVQSVSNSGGLVGIVIKSISGVLAAIISTAAKPFILALTYFIRGTPLMVRNPTVLHLWLVSTSMADALIVLVIALIGFHVMGAGQLGLNEVNIRSILPQTLLVFVLINTSIFWLDGIIELSNAMISGVGLLTNGSSPWNSLIKITTEISSYSLIALIIFVIFLIFSVILLVYYIGRLVTLYIGAVLAPLVILLWLLPGFRDFAENALKAYLSTVFVLFIHVIILALAGSMFAALNLPNGPNPLMDLLLGLATLVALIKTQGVMTQLNYASIGPKTARKLGGSFINGVSYMAVTSRYAWAQTAVSSRPPINRALPVSKGPPKS